MSRYTQSSRTSCTVAIAVAALLFAWSGSAWAAQGDIVSAPILGHGDGTYDVVCSFLNLGKKPVDVLVDIYNGDAGSIQDECPITVQSRQAEPCEFSSPGYNQNYWCEITGKFNPKQVRGTLEIRNHETGQPYDSQVLTSNGQ